MRRNETHNFDSPVGRILSASRVHLPRLWTLYRGPIVGSLISFLLLRVQGNNRDIGLSGSHTDECVPASTVIIVGEEPRKVVTIARSLHRHGVRSIVAVLDGQSLRVTSRAIAGVVHLDGGVEESAQLLRMLAE